MQRDSPKALRTTKGQPRTHTLKSSSAGPLLALLGCALIALPARGQGREPRSFSRVLLLESTSETSASVSIGDVDADGTPDVVLAKGRHWPLNNLLLRNDGKGHFTTENLADAPDRTHSAALADLDGDGDLDIGVSNHRPDRKLVYLNDGKGKYRVAANLGRHWAALAPFAPVPRAAVTITPVLRRGPRPPPPPERTGDGRLADTALRAWRMSRGLRGGLRSSLTTCR